MQTQKKPEQFPAVRCGLHFSRSAIPSVCDKDFGLYHHSFPSVPPLFPVPAAEQQLFSESTAFVAGLNCYYYSSTALTLTLHFLFVNTVLLCKRCYSRTSGLLKKFL